jgi:hypothetical protein
MEFRKQGKRVVVVPGVVYHHLPPGRLSRLLRQFYRNGIQAAFTNRQYSEWVIETPSRHGPFRTHLSFAFRICRFPLRLLLAITTLKPIWFLCEMAYATGFIYERLRPSDEASTRQAQ